MAAVVLFRYGRDINDPLSSPRLLVNGNNGSILKYRMNIYGETCEVSWKHDLGPLRLYLEPGGPGVVPMDPRPHY